MFTSPQQRWAYSQFRPTPIRHLDRGPGRVKRGLKKALGDRALRPQFHAQSEEFGPVRPDWRAERPSHDIHLIHGDPIGPYSTAPLKAAENRMRERVDTSRASARASRAAMNAASATIHTSRASAPASGAQLSASRASVHISRGRMRPRAVEPRPRRVNSTAKTKPAAFGCGFR